jgi:outer membrane biosynthesis protein TonB
VLIAGLIRWSAAARASSNPESIVWLGAADLAGDASEKQDSPPPKRATPPVESTPVKDDQVEEETPIVASAKSEIELPSPTPRPTSTPTPRPKVTSTPTPKSRSSGTTPKPLPKPTPKKTVLAKASPKLSHKEKPSAAKSEEKSEKDKKKSALAKKAVASQTGSGKADSVGKAGHAGGGNTASEFGWYGRMLHDRFYSAWIQPTTSVSSTAKISTLVKVRIEKDGRVSKFEIIKPSENVIVNESVATIAKRVTEVDAPPPEFIKGEHYEVKINFELNTDQQTGNE